MSELLGRVDRGEALFGASVGAAASLVVFGAGYLLRGWDPGLHPELEWSHGLSDILLYKGVGFGRSFFTVGFLLGMITLILLVSRSRTAFAASFLTLPLPLVLAVLLEHGFGSAEGRSEVWPALILLAYFVSAGIHAPLYIYGQKKYGAIYTFRDLRSKDNPKNGTGVR